MTPELETAVENAAKIITEQPGSAYTIEQARVLARNVMEAAGVDFSAPAREPTPKPATRPVAPRLPDMTGMSPSERSAAWRKQEQDLAAWHHVAQSYVEPISDAAIAAKARLLELRAASEADTATEKVMRAMEREKLMETILANGMARL